MLSQSLGTSAIRYADSDNIVVRFSLSINLQARFWRTLSARTLGAMRVILAAFIRLFTFRFRKRMSLELEPSRFAINLAFFSAPSATRR